MYFFFFLRYLREKENINFCYWCLIYFFLVIIIIIFNKLIVNSFFLKVFNIFIKSVIRFISYCLVVT